MTKGVNKVVERHNVVPEFVCVPGWVESVLVVFKYLMAGQLIS